MKKLALVFTLIVGSISPGISQHYNWSAVLASGIELTGIHPDSIRNDSVAFSNPEGGVYWVHLDSLQSLTYDYNPTIVTLCVMGGIIGCSGNNSTVGSRIIGGAFGFASGFLLSYSLGTGLGHDEVILEGLDQAKKKQMIRERTARWSGRVVMVQ